MFLWCCTEAMCVCLCLCLTTQKREAEQQAHDALVAQNQGLEREYQRFEKKQKLLKSIQVGRLLHPEDVVTCAGSKVHHSQTQLLWWHSAAPAKRAAAACFAWPTKGMPHACSPVLSCMCAVMCCCPLQVIKKKLAWMDVKDAQEAAKAAGQDEMEKEKQLKEARSAAMGDERPAKWVPVAAQQRAAPACCSRCLRA